MADGAFLVATALLRTMREVQLYLDAISAAGRCYPAATKHREREHSIGHRRALRRLPSKSSDKRKQALHQSCDEPIVGF
jgi:hypothetical protein